jgi:hypothetical protein
VHAAVGEPSLLEEVEIDPHVLRQVPRAAADHRGGDDHA